MTDTPVKVALDPRGVATLTLNRPQVHNAFDDRLIAYLHHELQRLEADPALRVVVLAAEGRSFSAGADLNWMKRMAGYSELENLEDALALARLLHLISSFARPVIARVQGPAFGGGVGLIACCDIAVASEKARFALSEVRLGLIPATVSPYVVAAVGERNARRYFITAEPFDAAEARTIGLVHQVVAPGELDGAVEHLVSEILKGGPGAVANAKGLVALVKNRPLDEALAAETGRRIALARVSAEGREGIAAFLEKRKPRWQEKP